MALGWIGWLCFMPALGDPMPSFNVAPAKGLVEAFQSIGTGKVAERGDLVFLQYKAEDETGRTLADSETRGLPYTMRIGDKGNDSLLEILATGMKSGDKRTVLMDVEDTYEDAAARSLLPKSGMVAVTISLLRVTPGGTKG